jgi:uracil DNA glycosylase
MEVFNSLSNDLTIEEIRYLYEDYAKESTVESFKKRRLIATKNTKLAKLIALIRCANDNNADYDAELISALDALTDSNNGKPLVSMLDQIKKNDSDCLYNGTVYRKLAFDQDKFIFALEKQCPDSEGSFPRKNVEDVLKSFIKTGTYQSATNDLEACENFYAEGLKDIGIIISFESKDGIDIMKLVNKYHEKLENISCDTDEEKTRKSKLISILNAIKQWYENEKQQPYFQQIMDTVNKMAKTEILSPDRDYWFRAFEVPDITKIHTIIVGSRPVKDVYSADGYAFSCIDEADREMGFLYRKLNRELGIAYDQYDNSKERWVQQGILPMTMELTTRNGVTFDNTQLWLPFTKRVLSYFMNDIQVRAFLFLDRYTTKMPELFVDKAEKKHLFLNYNIASSEFQKDQVFTRINAFVQENYNRDIDWR